MDFSSDSPTWGWIQRIALILGALASLIVIVEFPEGSEPHPKSTPPIVEERPAPPSPKPLPPTPQPTPVEIEPAVETVYKTPHGERYHRPSCQHVRGKDTAVSLSITEAREMGLTPCGTCNPDR